MMKGIMKSMTPHKAFEGKAESWKEWKENLEEYWDIHYPGAKAAMQELVKTGSDRPMDCTLGRHSTECKATMHALLRSLTVGEPKKITSGYEVGEAWESWKALCKHYEPVMAAQNHHASEHNLSLAKKAAKSPEETKKVIITLDE